MAYTIINFKSKKALKAAIAEGQAIEVFQPGLGSVPRDGSITLEGPHYPAAHSWYAVGTLENGQLVKVS